MTLLMDLHRCSDKFTTSVHIPHVDPGLHIHHLEEGLAGLDLDMGDFLSGLAGHHGHLDCHTVHQNALHCACLGNGDVEAEQGFRYPEEVHQIQSPHGYNLGEGEIVE